MDNQKLWDGFEIWDNIYPRDSTYSVLTVRDYENSIKQVVREGRTAAGVLTDSLDFVDDEVLREIQPDDDGGPGRGFALPGHFPGCKLTSFSRDACSLPIDIGIP